MSKKKVTVYDIAKELNISPSTVSRVLNNSTLISAEKRDLILDTANRLQYQKRTIKKQSTRAILNIRLFLPEAKYTYIHLFYDVAELIEGIQQGFDDVRVNIITSINDGDLSLFESKKLGDIDGCIFAYTVPSEAMEALLEEREIPIILINREQPENNYIMIDNLLGMDTLVEALYKKYGGGVKPCYIGFNPIRRVSEKREEGVREACRKRNIRFTESDVFNLDNIQELQQVVIHQILDQSYNSVLCFNDMVAVSVYQAILHRGLHVPESFSLTGFDNSPFLEILDQRIDTIDFTVNTLGKEAGLWLRRWIMERDCNPIQKKIEGKYIAGDTI